MCTTVGFKYKEGYVFGRTLELGMTLDNKLLFVPRDKDFIEGKGVKYSSKYACIGTGFFDIASFGDGINEAGLMASNNFLPGYATFAKEPVEGKVNLTMANSFDYLLSRCKDVKEVKEAVRDIIVLEHGDDEKDKSTEAHFFFMDAKGDKLVLEPRDGLLVQYENPYGV